MEGVRAEALPYKTTSTECHAYLKLYEKNNVDRKETMMIAIEMKGDGRLSRHLE